MKTQFRRIAICLLLIIAGTWINAVKAWDFTNGKIIYFDNTVTNWSQAYLRVGHTTWNSAYLMSKVTGTQNLYSYTIPSWGGYEAFAIANNAAWTNGNSIYNVCTGDSYQVTGSTVYQNYSVSTDYTLIPTGVNNTDGCCTYYATSATSGLKTYSVTYSQPTGGTINVTYTNTSGTTGNLASGNSVVPTCIITVTATANSGYALETLTINGSAFTSGNTFVVRGNTTIAATFNSKPTNVTLSATSSITANQATLNGNIGTNGGVNITDYGFYYSTTNGFADGSGTKVQVGTSNFTGNFSKVVSGLSAGTTYYIKAYATNSIGTTYSTQGSFETSVATCSTPFTLQNASVTFNSCDITKILPQVVAATGSLPANAQYTWSPATGLSATNVARPTFTGNSSQNYTVTVTNQDETLCVASTTVSVTYTDNTPIASLTTANYTVEPGSNFVLSGANANGSYFWEATGGSFNVTTGTLTPTYTAPSTVGIYTIKLISPAIGNCSPDTAFATVNVCEPITIKVKQPDNWSSTMYLFVYNINGGTSDGNFKPMTSLGADYQGKTWWSYTIDVDTTSLYAIFVDGGVWNSANEYNNQTNNLTSPITESICYTLSSNTTGKKTVSESTCPLFCNEPFTLNSNSLTINRCDANKTLPVITAASGSIPTGALYNWSPATGLDNASKAQPIFTGTNSQTYTITVTDSNGICNASTTVSVTYNNNLPTATLVTKYYCVTPDSSFTIANAQATGSYNWSCSGGSLSATSGTLTPTYTAPSNTGKYIIKLVSPGVGTCETAIDSATVMVVNEPIVLATPATNVTGSTAIINAAISDNGGALPKEQGFFYSTTNLADFKTGTKVIQGDSAITNFYHQLSGLPLNTTYYYKAYVDNGLGITLSTNTETFTTASTSYRLEVSSGGNTYYSNELNSDGTFSLYTFQNSAIVLKQWNGSTWTYISEVTFTADSTVVQIPFTFATQALGSPSEYMGDFYIRTDIATGGWNNYLDTSKDNKMTFFTKYVAGADLFSDTYDHYWVKWVSLPGGTNLKAQVGNIYNSNISDFTDNYVVSGNGKYSAAGVRFTYDKRTNTLTRHQLVTSTLTIGNQAPIDRNDWMYEYTFESAPNIIDVIGKNEWEGPTTYNSVNTVSCKLNGKRVRATFDYKTNRLTYGWLPTNNPSSADPNPIYEATVTDTINADAVFISNEYGAAGLITSNCSIQLNGRIVVRKTYKTGEFGYWHWMSFPYDVAIRDVYGLDGYGVKYIIRAYDSAKRAKDGFQNGTNWVYLSKQDTLFANVGYSLGFSTNRSIQTELNNKGEITINYPSIHSGFLFSTEAAKLYRSSTFLPDPTLPFSEFPDYTPEHSYRKSNQDWYLMGQPSFKFNKATGPTYIIRHEGQKENASDSVYGFVGYLAADYQIPHFQSYFIQYHGYIDFGNVTEAQHAPRRLPEEQTPDEFYYLYLKNQNYSERTCFILAEEGNDIYEINKDLSKMIEKNHYPQLYSTTGGYGLEFNHLAKTTQTVPLSVWIGNKGEFNFVLEKREGQKATSVILTDILLGQQTDLMQTNYTVNFATSGVTIDNRFTITFDLEPKVVTSKPVNSTSEVLVNYANETIYINNVPEYASAYLVDMLGRKVKSWTTTHEQLTLPKLTNGVYLLMIDYGSHSESHKLIIRK
ncbi:MAG TPA: T9SS type A sorting domain-containing protein [Paludibacteraceae bacterium]|nr:T9SS type A sorting domain-containing protein [Paludibacteraceae bacterium]